MSPSRETLGRQCGVAALTLAAVSLLAWSVAQASPRASPRAPIDGLQTLDHARTWEATSGAADFGSFGDGARTATFGVAPAGFDPSATATTNVGGYTFDLNTFLGADAYYDAVTPIFGQNTVTTNLRP